MVGSLVAVFVAIYLMRKFFALNIERMAWYEILAYAATLCLIILVILAILPPLLAPHATLTK